MAKPAILVATGQSPVSGLVDRPPHQLGVSAQLTENEHGIEAGVHVPIWLFDVPATARLLVPQNPRDHLLGPRRRLADQAEVVRHVERGSDMIAQVTVFGLAAYLTSAQHLVVFFGKRFAERCIEEREETGGVPGQLLE